MSRFEIATKIIELLIGAVVGGALIGVGYLQYTVYRQQTAIMEMTDRPLIGGPIDLSSATTDGAISFTMTFRNVGHSATTSFYIEAELLDSKENRDWYTAVPTLCKSATGVVAAKHPHFTAIPGADWTLNLDQMPPKAGLIVTSDSFGAMNNPSIVGCAAYTSPFDQIVHQTGFRVVLRWQGNIAAKTAVYTVDAD
jgi:hypothetical protein